MKGWSSPSRKKKKATEDRKKEGSYIQMTEAQYLRKLLGKDWRNFRFWSLGWTEYHDLVKKQPLKEDNHLHVRSYSPLFLFLHHCIYLHWNFTALKIFFRIYLIELLQIIEISDRTILYIYYFTNSINCLLSCAVLFI